MILELTDKQSQVVEKLRTILVKMSQAEIQEFIFSSACAVTLELINKKVLLIGGTEYKFVQPRGEPSA